MKPQSEGMDFSQALRLIKTGSKLTRLGWNGNITRPDGRVEIFLWVALQKPDKQSKMTLPYIYMHTRQGDLVPWLASQTDLLADDWVVLE